MMGPESRSDFTRAGCFSQKSEEPRLGHPCLGRYNFVIAEFLSKEQQEKVASLQIQPLPDQLIRVYALFQASSSTDSCSLLAVLHFSTFLESGAFRSLALMIVDFCTGCA